MANLLPRHEPRLPFAMRPVVYFPELRTRKTVVPAHVAIGADAPQLNPSVTATTDFALNGGTARLESVSMPRPSRRRPFVHTTVIEA